MEESLAKRYSSAFFGIAINRNKVEELFGEFSQFYEFLKENPKVEEFIVSKEIDTSQKLDTLNEVFSKDLSPEVLHFIFVIIKKHREYLLDSIMFTLRKQYLQYNNIKEAKVISSYDLPEEDINRIKDILEKKTGKKIILNSEKDPTIIGGLKVWLENTVYDLSILGYLERLRSKLVKADI
jgi:F-type H+-transporting ATPase subunit delta